MKWPANELKKFKLKKRLLYFDDIEGNLIKQ